MFALKTEKNCKSEQDIVGAIHKVSALYIPCPGLYGPSLWALREANNTLYTSLQLC